MNDDKLIELIVKRVQHDIPCINSFTLADDIKLAHRYRAIDLKTMLEAESDKFYQEVTNILFNVNRTERTMFCTFAPMFKTGG